MPHGGEGDRERQIFTFHAIPDGPEFLCLSEHESSGDSAIFVTSASHGLREEALTHPSGLGTVAKPFELDGLLSMGERDG